MLGTRWSANANFISIGTYAEADRVRQSAGPTISSLLDFTDGYVKNERFVVEDDGFPNLLLNTIKACLDNGVRTPIGKHLLKELEEYLRDDSPLRSLMVWLSAGKDAGDGQLLLKRRWFMPWKRVLSLMWEVEHSRRRARGHERDASEPDRGHRRASARPPDMEPLEESGDAPPAGRRADGRRRPARGSSTISGTCTATRI